VPVLLITLQRPGHAVRWADKPYYTQIGLGSLDQREVGDMVRNLLGTGEFPPDLVPRIHEKAEGNPLFVEEIVNALCGANCWRSDGLLDRRRGGEVRHHGVIRARIDRLASVSARHRRQP
jgi:predicted ATPase